MSKITLENMEFHAYHGCLEHEQQFGNTFLVTLSMEFDSNLAEQSDHLNDTLNYKLVYDEVKKQMDIPSKLIEHLAKSLTDKLMQHFQQINSLKVKISKLNPPLGGRVESVFIEMEMNRINQFT